MSKTLYHLSLKLLPRFRRDRYGDEMRDVYAALVADARRNAGRVGAHVLLMKEVGGIMRFALRERLDRLRDWQPAGGWHPLRELHWAWRGVRARGWRAAFVVALLGVVLAANTVVFSAADAFVFRTVPYPAADQLVIVKRIERDPTVSDYLPRHVVAQWRKHRDLFVAMHAHLRSGSAYVTIDGITETVRAEGVTPGLFELLGVVPAWGRPFVESDAEPGGAPVVIISEPLSRRLYGAPRAAVGQPLPEGRNAPTIVGVMPATFRFPTATEEIWRPLSLAPDPSARFPSNVRNVARLAPGVTPAAAAAMVEARASAVGAASIPWPTASELRARPITSMQLEALTAARRNAGAALIFAMLVGAAACLLLIVCSNVASLEMAGAVRRRRAHAVQSALGASSGSLVRIAWLEGAVLLAGSVAAALPLALWGSWTLAGNLTAAMRDALTNPLDLDVRALAFMLFAAAAALLMTTVPGARRHSDLSLADALRDDVRVMPATRTSARVRQLLMVTQVALTVLLLVGGLLYVRTYLARLGIDRGLDDAALVSIQVSPASDAPRRGGELETAVLERLRATPGLRFVARSQLIPPSTEAGIIANLQIEGRETSPGRVMLSTYDVDPEYFETVGSRIVEGRAFTASSPRDEIVVNGAFARRFFPAGRAIGSRFSMQGAGSGGVTSFHIVGTASDFRQDRIVRDSGEEVHILYTRMSPTYHPLSFVARLEHERQLPAIAAVVRSVAERSVVRTDTMAARFARLDGDKRLAASITGGFGLLALVVATAGVYGVMAFLVAGRSREIGIRMALGADRGAVQRLVFRSSLAAVGGGALIGVAAALAASRWMASQLYGVTAADPATYGAVCGLVVATALAATWLPARRAARIDPATTLRSS